MKPVFHFDLFFIVVDTKISLKEGAAKFVRGTDGGVNTLIANKGRNFTLTCRTELIPLNPVFKWQRSPFGEETFTELLDGGDIDVEFSHNLREKEWSMTLKEIAEENAGIYACEMYDGAGGNRVGTDTVYATVFDAPIGK